MHINLKWVISQKTKSKNIYKKTGAQKLQKYEFINFKGYHNSDSFVWCCRLFVYFCLNNSP